MSGRIALHRDPGLGWTKPVFVAGCGDCGTELARSTDQATAARAASRRRCLTCGTRTARRLPGTTSLATDLALAGGRRELPSRKRRHQTATPAPDPSALEGGEIPCPRLVPG